MKRLFRNIKSWNDILNIILILLATSIIKIVNAFNYLKMCYYKIRKVPYYFSNDIKFGILSCHRKEK